MALALTLLADTHLPRRAKDLPAEVWAAVEAADVVLHAGDWVDVALLDELSALRPEDLAAAARVESSAL